MLTPLKQNNNFICVHVSCKNGNHCVGVWSVWSTSKRLLIMRGKMAQTKASPINRITDSHKRSKKKMIKKRKFHVAEGLRAYYFHFFRFSCWVSCTLHTKMLYAQWYWLVLITYCIALSWKSVKIRLQTPKQLRDISSKRHKRAKKNK